MPLPPMIGRIAFNQNSATIDCVVVDKGIKPIYGRTEMTYKMFKAKGTVTNVPIIENGDVYVSASVEATQPKRVTGNSDDNKKILPFKDKNIMPFQILLRYGMKISTPNEDVDYASGLRITAFMLSHPGAAVVRSVAVGWMTATGYTCNENTYNNCTWSDMDKPLQVMVDINENGYIYKDESYIHFVMIPDMYRLQSKDNDKDDLFYGPVYTAIQSENMFPVNLSKDFSNTNLNQNSMYYDNLSSVINDLSDDDLKDIPEDIWKCLNDNYWGFVLGDGCAVFNKNNGEHTSRVDFQLSMGAGAGDVEQKVPVDENGNKEIDVQTSKLEEDNVNENSNEE